MIRCDEAMDISTTPPHPPVEDEVSGLKSHPETPPPPKIGKWQPLTPPPPSITSVKEKTKGVFNVFVLFSF